MLAGHCWGGFDAAGGAEPLGGLPAGLHAKGFPSGAQHVPVMEPRSVVKLHCIPLLEPSQAWIASGGGARCCPGSPGGCDIAGRKPATHKSVVRITGLVDRMGHLLISGCGGFAPIAGE